MVFEVSAAKEEILRKFTKQDWTPTELAEELEKSRNAVYNHLNNLYERGLVTKEKVAAKTRPKTRYSVGEGIIHYISVLPGQYVEKTLELTPEKEAMFRIWSLPQAEFHRYVEDYWFNLRKNVDVDYPEKVSAVAVYGSVARGEASEGSDLDMLVIVEDEDTRKVVEEQFGTHQIRTSEGARLAMAEVYTLESYRNSIAHNSQFIKNIRDEIHIIYDPEKLLVQPGAVLNEF